MGERADIVPQGEPLRRAVRWLSDRRLADPGAQPATLVEEASVRFDLTPLEEQFLLEQWAREPSYAARFGE
ncbi:MAG TPA: hypothetical protein VLW85_22830 [Myxococcales bacterium]|nr:hypothetical protein [Myxococcales bacterium]